jgi:hypothetical protein
MQVRECWQSARRAATSALPAAWPAAFLFGLRELLWLLMTPEFLAVFPPALPSVSPLPSLLPAAFPFGLRELRWLLLRWLLRSVHCHLSALPSRPPWRMCGMVCRTVRMVLSSSRAVSARVGVGWCG